MRVRLIGHLKSLYGEVIEVKLDGEVRFTELIELLIDRYPKLKDELDDLNAFNYSLNGELLKKDELEKVKVRNDDELIVIPAISGGSCPFN